MLRARSYFVFNGIKTSELGIYVEKQPDIISPPLRSKSISVPGKSGNLYIEEKENSLNIPVYDSYIKTVTCSIILEKYITFIAEWLKGQGEVIFSNELDKVYKANINNQIPLNKILIYGKWRRFPVVFEVQPFKHNVNAENDRLVFTGTKPVSFMGKGSVPSAPIITVYGNGNSNITINNQTITLIGVDGFITINGEIMDAYKEGTNQNNKMVGAFPYLSTGQNTLSYTGNVTKIEITPAWRWI